MARMLGSSVDEGAEGRQRSRFGRLRQVVIVGQRLLTLLTLNTLSMLVRAEVQFVEDLDFQGDAEA
jgi:hypothetical protein